MTSVMLGMLCVMSAFIGYAMTLNPSENVRVSGIIICSICLLILGIEFILYCIFHRNDKGE